MEAEIEVEKCIGGGGKVELEGVGGLTAQPLDTLVEHAVVICVLGCSLAEAVARVVGLGEAIGRILDTTPPPPPVQNLRLTWRQGLGPRIAVTVGPCTVARGTAIGLPFWKLRLRLNSVPGVVVK